ncbi:MAG: hypothetical protein ABW185_28490, partial [Sedimenticola sp.]
ELADLPDTRGVCWVGAAGGGGSRHKPKGLADLHAPTTIPTCRLTPTTSRVMGRLCLGSY